ncbi:hypothetical protein [Methylobacterium sp. WL120]|uniref:hypothetical protein n=1 Tax=Methylobacterium sp. WL120 TaxID=2603887 RepID=UPI0011C85445|nr:hypothetical protein [Methylobacterium sp. WL120]TXM63972.1 hypothetical protein FV229_20350 [Methylobacterium sp. WL120]
MSNGLLKALRAIFIRRPLPPDIVPPGETPEQTERRIKEADAAHEQQFRAQLVTMPTVIAFGTEAMKSAALINGGAAAALLAYIGAGRQEVTLGLIEAIRSFGTGLLCAAIAHAGSYITQFLYQHIQSLMSQHFVYPYIRVTRSSKIAFVFAVMLHVITLGLVCFAFWCAIKEFYGASDTLHPMDAVQPKGR